MELMFYVLVALLLGIAIGYQIRKQGNIPVDPEQAFSVILTDSLIAFQKELASIDVADTDGAKNCVARASDMLSRLKASYLALKPHDNFEFKFNKQLQAFPWLRTYNLGK